MTLSTCIGVVGISLGAAIFSEGVNWLLIYRTESYQVLKGSVERSQKKLEKMKEEGGATVDNRAKGKKLERFEATVKEQSRQLSMMKMKSTMVVAFTMITLLGYLNSMYEGQVVAKLPFEPFGFLQGMSHRGLAGNDATDCSMIFIYILSGMFIRSNISKLLGNDVKMDNASMFAPPAQ